MKSTGRRRRFQRANLPPWYDFLTQPATTYGDKGTGRLKDKDRLVALQVNTNVALIFVKEDQCGDLNGPRNVALSLVELD